MAAVEWSEERLPAEWVWQSTKQIMEIVWTEESEECNEDGEKVVDTWTLEISYDLLDMIVSNLDLAELAWVRGVCRGLREAADYWWTRKFTATLPRGWGNCIPRKTIRGGGRGAGRMAEMLVEEKKRTWKACRSAARSGCLAALIVARENGCEWHVDVCTAAAEFGHLKLLQWSLANGCPWSIWTYIRGAANGHLEILKWLRENGYPWDMFVCIAAIGDNCEAILEWLHSGKRAEWPCATKSQCLMRLGIPTYPCEWARKHRADAE